MAFFLVVPAPTLAAQIELGGGSTFKRHKALKESGVANLCLITQENTRWPTEWSVGYNFAQKKNSGRLNNDKSVAWVGVGKKFRWKAIMLGLGAVIVDQTSQRLSTNFNFKTEIGLQAGPFVALVHHISNGGIRKPNDGETLFLLNYRFPLDFGPEHAKSQKFSDIKNT